MSSPPPRSSKRSSLSRRILAYGALLAFAGLAALGIAEVVLRLVPIPGITYHSFYFDPVTGGKYYPNTTLIYRSPEGVQVVRHANSWGFPDVEHAPEPAPGTLRIGFFGDSYTEAMQVPIEETFFRVVERDLNARIADLAGEKNRRGEPVQRVETFSFGISGRSTLQSYLECHQWMARCDLDVVVYVFVENDPGDNIPRMRGSDEVPLAALAGDSFTVDDSFNQRYRHKTTWWHRAMQRIKAKSLVVSTLEGRLKLLKRYGIKRAVTEADRAGGAQGGGVTMVPSAWPQELVEDAWTLVERILDRWTGEVASQGRAFVILRVPREEVIAEPLAGQDSWAPRLHDYCARRAIPLVDPTPLFVPRIAAGESIYYDHFTPLGNRVFGEAFVGYWLARASR
jgi:hypothetical protein